MAIDGFDVVIASLILDVVATDLKTFRDALSNIQDVLLPGKKIITKNLLSLLSLVMSRYYHATKR